MTERKHNLPSRYDRLEDQVTGDVVDSIVIHPRSHGRLHMPGEYSTDSRPPAHRVDRASSATDNQGVDYEPRLLGGPDHYLVTYDVWNHRDSPSFASIVLTDNTNQDKADTPQRVKTAAPALARAIGVARRIESDVRGTRRTQSIWWSVPHG